MNVNDLAPQLMGTAYVPFGESSGILANPAISANPAGLLQGQGESGLFTEMLKKAQSANLSPSGEEDPVKPTSGKKAIDKTDKLYELCLELETFLIKNLIKGMRNTVQKSKLIDTGFAGEVYEDMLYDEYAKAYAKNASFGLAEMAYRELAGK